MSGGKTSLIPLACLQPASACSANEPVANEWNPEASRPVYSTPPPSAFALMRTLSPLIQTFHFYASFHTQVSTPTLNEPLRVSPLRMDGILFVIPKRIVVGPVNNDLGPAFE